MFMKKNSYSKNSSRLLAYIYACVLCTHIRIQASCPNPWAPIQVPDAQCVPVCAYTHTIGKIHYLETQQVTKKRLLFDLFD